MPLPPNCCFYGLHTNWWYSVPLSEFEPLFLNGAQRSVNRKVQGSNPWSGAKTELKLVGLLCVTAT
jgi:hypothetical protein